MTYSYPSGSFALVPRDEAVLAPGAESQKPLQARLRRRLREVYPPAGNLPEEFQALLRLLDDASAH